MSKQKGKEGKIKGGGREREREVIEICAAEREREDLQQIRLI